jgi:HD-GYP domain-containing protein (c-di-GMP phosphodiesterase class II)
MYERSNETEEHSVRLAKYASMVGKKLSLSLTQLDELELTAMLHDIGKIGVDDNVLKKPGSLTKTEWIQMKRHPEIGYRIAISSPELSHIADFILSHHERWDGEGYPRGLKGTDIPIQARIIAVVDAYDAMTNDRPYRKGLSKKEAIDEIAKNSGIQFDPQIVEAFLAVL